MTDNKPPDPWVPIADWERATADGVTEECAFYLAIDGAEPIHFSHVQITKGANGTIHVTDPNATLINPVSEEWKAALDRLGDAARARPTPQRATPIDWPTWVAHLERQQARRVRRRRRRATVNLCAALAVAVLMFVPLADSIAHAMWWPAVPFWTGGLIAASVWVVDEYRALRRALRPGFYDAGRRRP